MEGLREEIQEKQGGGQNQRVRDSGVMEVRSPTFFF